MVTINMSAPEKIDKYVIEGLIAEGGMGKVYKAKDPDLDRDVAIKFLRDEYLSDEIIKKRFMSEAKLTARIDHRNIVKVYALGEHEGVTYIAMEFLSGHTLINTKTRLPMDLHRVHDYFSQMLEGLRAAHTEGIVHRDIKPSNIMINHKGDLKVMDFGLARSRQSDQMLTAPGSIFGTVAYMAPEVAKGKKATAQSDIYSLGIVLYQMLTGKIPFVADSSLETLENIKTQNLETPDSLNPLVTPAIRDIVMRMCAKPLDERFASVEEIIPLWRDIEGLTETTPATPMQAERENIEKHLTSFHIDKSHLDTIIDKARKIQEGQNQQLGKNTVVDIGREMDLPESIVLQAISEFDNEQKTQATQRQGVPPLYWVIGLVSLLLGIFAFLTATRLGTFEENEQALEPKPKRTIPVVKNPVTSGLIAHYTFDGHARDTSPYRNHAKVLGPKLSTDRFGRPGRAYEFMGTGPNVIVIPHNDALNLSGKNFTMSLWVYFEVINNEANTLVAKWTQTNAGVANGYRFTLHGTHFPPNLGLQFHAFNQSPKLALHMNQRSVEGWKAKRWYHLVLLRKDKVLIFYRDLKSLGVVSHHDPLPSSTADLLIGSQFVATKKWSLYPLIGKIDELRIYDRALSEKELQKLNGRNAETKTRPVLWLQSHEKKHGEYDLQDETRSLNPFHNGIIHSHQEKIIGNTSIFLNRTPISIHHHDLIEFKDKPFTIECYFLLKDMRKVTYLYSRAQTSYSSNRSVDIRVHTNGSINVHLNHGGSTNQAVYFSSPKHSIRRDRWYHMAVCRDHHEARLYINGRISAREVLPNKISINQVDSIEPAKIGAKIYPGDYYSASMIGYIDNYIISHGVKYKGESFTPSKSRHSKTSSTHKNP